MHAKCSGWVTNGLAKFNLFNVDFKILVNDEYI